MSSFNYPKYDSLSYKLILLPTGEWVREYAPTRESLGQLDTLILNAVDGTIRVFPNFYDGWTIIFPPREEPISFTRLKTLTLQTTYSEAIEGNKRYIFPTFGNTLSSASVKASMKLSWNPPDDMYLILLYHSKSRLSYLSALSTVTKKLYRLPLSNLYEDGKLCLGRAASAALSATSGCIEQSRVMIKQFESGEWNTDLSPNLTFTKAIMQFSLDGESLVVRKDWYSILSTMSNIYLNMASEQILKEYA